MKDNGHGLFAHKDRGKSAVAMQSKGQLKQQLAIARRDAKAAAAKAASGKKTR